jgi:hypothetical protein
VREIMSGYLDQPVDASDITQPFRKDCAEGNSVVVRYHARGGLPEVIYIARRKPTEGHAKAGNLNNALYNYRYLIDAQFVAVFDHDHRPHRLFLQATLPFFRSADGKSWENDVGFVQTPQYVHEAADQMKAMDDPFGHRNAVFFAAVQPGRDVVDACLFAGTNAVFRMTVRGPLSDIDEGREAAADDV